MKNSNFSQQNVIISSILCLGVGSIIFFNSNSILWSSASVTIFIAGIILLVMGLFLKISSALDIKKINNWIPDNHNLPDVGRPMYRVDTTLFSPIRTSILCGRCKHIEWIDGSKPKFYSCINCGILLWHNNEEE